MTRKFKVLCLDLFLSKITFINNYETMIFGKYIENWSSYTSANFLHQAETKLRKESITIYELELEVRVQPTTHFEQDIRW